MHVGVLRLVLARHLVEQLLHEEIPSPREPSEIDSPRAGKPQRIREVNENPIHGPLHARDTEVVGFQLEPIDEDGGVLK